MTEVEYVKNLLDANWQTSISGRTNDVPKPKIVLEKESRDERLNTQDVAYVASGGDTEFTPMGFGWTHEGVDTVVVIEIRAATRNTDTGLEHGYKRLYGERTGANGLQAPDDWSGITGEARRIIMNQRKGQGEWDLVGPDLRIDDTRLGGKNYWRADMYVPLESHADSIDPSP